MLIPTQDVADITEISVATLRQWVKKGLLRSYRGGVQQELLNVAEVLSLYNKLHTTQPTQNEYKILESSATPFTTIGLFAGAGGTALGLENAGFQHLAVNELDKHATATLHKNRPDWNVLETDIAETSFSEYAGAVDLIEAGFPCQPFSTAGKGMGFADVRGTLFGEFAKVVEAVQPKVAVGENVKGLLHHDNGTTLQVILQKFAELGYTVYHKVLRSQFLHVPQKRERLFIVAVRNDITTPFTFPAEDGHLVSLRDAIGDRPQSAGLQYSTMKQQVLSQVPEGGDWRDLPDLVQRSYMGAAYSSGGGRTGIARRLSWNEPSLTLTCSPAQKQTERCHPDETRPLNIREYARIQTFPDEWVFEGSVAQQYKQIGNAVPVNMAYHVGMAVRKLLESSTT